MTPLSKLMLSIVATAILTGILAHIGSMAVLVSGFILFMMVTTSPLIYLAMENDRK